jgi:coenzyme F420-0:L-glutamate ligase/coenzyme F420-1:gamma-L-glutamate ligase
LCQLILDEAAEVVRTAPNLVIVRNRHGVVLANAGIDASNVADPESAAQVLLWPLDPDASAARLREALQPTHADISVIVSDSLGRAWRMGTMGTAIGVAGMLPLRDQCGDTDLFGRTLVATVTGVADEIAAAASLMMGEGGEGVPAAIVRGARFVSAEGSGSATLIRSAQQDLFR